MKGQVAHTQAHCGAMSFEVAGEPPGSSVSAKYEGGDESGE